MILESLIQVNDTRWSPDFAHKGASQAAQFGIRFETGVIRYRF